VALEIADDGAGFEAQPPGYGDAPAARHGSVTIKDGLGLTSMRDRANSAGGSLTIDSSPGSGTVVRVEVPRA
jgi:signal transduction histidine kinase